MHSCLNWPPQVLRDFRPPEGRSVSPADMDADGNGKLLVVLDLHTDVALYQVLPRARQHLCA